jgi:nucleoside triphosphate diphosphatase
MTIENSPINQLLEVMRKLRDPENGCPWDIEQTFSTIAPHTIEEAYEVAEAIAENDMPELKAELGDLMFQVVFYAQMAKEQGDFDFNDVVQGITDKMISRHPHVFGDVDVETADAQVAAWEETKAKERAAKALSAGKSLSALDGVAKTLPSLTRAEKLQKRAARVGFDWPDLDPVYGKINEEIQELQVEVQANSPKEMLEDEFGDILFAVVNLGRKIGLDPEVALNKTNRKFTRRFNMIEDALNKKESSPAQSNLEEMDALWNEAKKTEKSAI